MYDLVNAVITRLLVISDYLGLHKQPKQNFTLYQSIDNALKAETVTLSAAIDIIKSF